MWLKSISTCTLGQALGYRHAHPFHCCRQVHGYLSWNIPLAKTKRASSEYLKIALDWQPNCHYSFHHSYQPCGAHAVGGQSRCFHGAFHASPSAQPSSYPLISSLFSNPVLCFPSMICSSHPSMASSSSSSIFFLSSSACLDGSTDERDQIQCRDEDEEECRSQGNPSLLSSWTKPQI